MTTTSPEDLISVIIPVYNGARYLGEAIESVIAQTYRPIEIIIVDDGSTDESALIAQQYPIRYIYQKQNGPGQARNLGIEQANGSFLAFLDADDLWISEKLTWQMAVLTAQPELEAVFGQVVQFSNPKDNPNAPSARFLDTVMNGIHAGTLLIRREAFMRIGLFDLNFHVVDFVDWYIRAQEAHLSTFTLPKVVMRRRAHANNLTIRSRDIAFLEYTKTLKASLDRKRKGLT
jgi:glycosyltransferase involved in cell wall biosynthesis